MSCCISVDVSRWEAQLYRFRFPSSICNELSVRKCVTCDDLRWPFRGPRKRDSAQNINDCPWKHYTEWIGMILCVTFEQETFVRFPIDLWLEKSRYLSSLRARCRKIRVISTSSYFMRFKLFEKKTITFDNLSFLCCCVRSLKVMWLPDLKRSNIYILTKVKSSI